MAIILYGFIKISNTPSDAIVLVSFAYVLDRCTSTKALTSKRHRQAGWLPRQVGRQSGRQADGKYALLIQIIYVPPTLKSIHG